MTCPIYLDYHASTPVDPRVFEVMRPYFCEVFGNSSSRSHVFGWRADSAVSDARLSVLELINARSPDEVVFTSGATESNNLAIRGVAQARGRGHIVTTAFEHPCVLETCRSLEASGFDHTVVEVSADGLVSPGAIEAAIRPDTILVSVMAVQNEVGTIQPISEISRIVRERGITMHCDAAQAIGRVAIDVRQLGVDLLSLSAHKFYGPKGVGVLYRRRSPQLAPLTPQMSGGGQERGSRAGTLNVPGIVGLGAAARIVMAESETEVGRLRLLRDRLAGRLRSEVPDLKVHGSLEHRIAANLNVAFGSIQADAFLNSIPELALSGGAACSSGKAAGSHVLRAMGLTSEEANRAVRISLGRFTTAAEVDRASELLTAAAKRLSR